MPVSFLFVGLLACSDGTGSASCRIDGHVVVCGDDYVSVPAPCYATLPDLNGDGEVNESDCALVGLGAATRLICEEPNAWLHHEACRGPSIKVDFDAADVASAAWLGKPADMSLVYSTVTSIWLSSPAYPEPKARKIVDVTDSVILYASRRYFSGATLPTDIVIFKALRLDARPEIRMWSDDDGNQRATANELRVIGQGDRVTVFEGDPLMVAFFGGEGSGSEWTVWTDSNRDRIVQPDELHRGDWVSGFSRSDLVGGLGLSNGQSQTLKTWPVVDGAIQWDRPRELTIPGESCKGRIVPSSDFFVSRNDDGAWRGTILCEGDSDHGPVFISPSALRGVPLQSGISNLVVQPRGAQHSIDGEGWAFAFEYGGLSVWLDTDDNEEFDFLERGLIDDTPNDSGKRMVLGVGRDHSGFGVLYVTSSGQLRSLWVTPPPSLPRYLGEECSQEIGYSYCVGGLLCQLSGNAKQPTCVPPVGDR